MAERPSLAGNGHLDLILFDLQTPALLVQLVNRPPAVAKLGPNVIIL
jgi:hypothetical protein